VGSGSGFLKMCGTGVCVLLNLKDFYNSSLLQEFFSQRIYCLFVFFFKFFSEFRFFGYCLAKLEWHKECHKKNDSLKEYFW